VIKIWGVIDFLERMWGGMRLSDLGDRIFVIAITVFLVITIAYLTRGF